MFDFNDMYSFTLTLFNVNSATIYGDIKPGTTIIIPHTPIIMPEKFGLKSTIPANGPVDNDPLNVIDTNKNITANTELHPAYANANKNIALPILQKAQPSLRTFVRLILLERNKKSPSFAK